MLNVKIDAPLDEAIARQAKRERKTKPAFVRRIVENYLDYVTGMAVLKKGGRSVPLSTVKKRVDLESRVRAKR